MQVVCGRCGAFSVFLRETTDARGLLSHSLYQSLVAFSLLLVLDWHRTVENDRIVMY